MELYFIRHTAVAVPKGTCYGWSDVETASTFEAEATLVCQQLATIFFDRVYTSPLSRCRKLATHCGYANAQQEERVKELNFGAWEMKEWDKISDPQLAVWFEDWINERPTEGESFRDLYERVSEFISELLKRKEEHIAIFTHGGVICSALIYFGQSTFETVFSEIPTYGSINRFEMK